MRSLLALALVVFCSGCASTRPETAPVERPATTARPVSAAALEHLNAGDSAQAAGNMAPALAQYLRAAEMDSHSDVPWLRVAGVYERLRNNQLALRAYESALQRNASRPDTWESIGFVLLREHRLTDAADAFQHAISQSPQRWRAEMGWGLALHGLSQFAESRIHFDKALAHNLDSAELLAYSAELWLSSGNATRALNQARASLDLLDAPATRLLIGDCLARSGDLLGGFEAYMGPLGESAAYARVGAEALRLKRYDDAIHFLQEAMRTSRSYNETLAKGLAEARERLREQLANNRP
jgi:tetratricopeptide (TPR) repeat protein